MSNNSTVSIGIDLGDKYSLVTILDQEGELVEENLLPTSRKGFERKFPSIPTCKIAQYILGPFGPDCNLRRWWLQLAERGGKNAKKRAVVVARKLAILLHHLWKTGEVYDPFYLYQLPEEEPDAIPATA